MLMDGKVVLARHRAGASTYHLLPGGGVRYRETLEEALRREVAEETGLVAKVVRPLFINDTIDPSGRRHVVNLTFWAEVSGGEITACPDDRRVEAVDLVEPASLSGLDLRPPLADAIGNALATGIEVCETRYLGPLFTEGRDA